MIELLLLCNLASQPRKAFRQGAWLWDFLAWKLDEVVEKMSRALLRTQFVAVKHEDSPSTKTLWEEMWKFACLAEVGWGGVGLIYSALLLHIDISHYLFSQSTLLSSVAFKHRPDWSGLCSDQQALICFIHTRRGSGDPWCHNLWSHGCRVTPLIAALQMTTR